MSQPSDHHFGIGIALLVGLVTALAATVAVVVKAKREERELADYSDDFDEVLGI
jgi:hypothetical protein